MEQVAVNSKSDNKIRKWYNGYVFPLIPVLETREANEYNTASFSFSWLFFRCWTLNSFDFELTLVASNHWGIGVIGILPYLRWAITIPVPQKISRWTQKKLWRKSASEKQ